MRKNLNEKKVIIINKKSMFYGDWGIITDYDGEYYHIAINGIGGLVYITPPETICILKEA